MLRAKNARRHHPLRADREAEDDFSNPSSTFRIDDIADIAHTEPDVEQYKEKPVPVQKYSKKSGRPGKFFVCVLLGAIGLRFLLALRSRPTMVATAISSAKKLRLLRRRRGHLMMPKRGEYAPLQKDSTLSPLERLYSAPTQDYHIFVLQHAQSNPPILINLLMGLFDEKDDHIAFLRYNGDIDSYEAFQKDGIVDSSSTVVSQTTEVDVNPLQRAFRPQYKHLFFVALKTPDAEIPDCVAPPDNLLCVQKSDLFYESSESEVIAWLVGRIQKTFPYFAEVSFDLDKASKRLRKMKRMLNKMRDVPSSTFETKYGNRGLST